MADSNAIDARSMDSITFHKLPMLFEPGSLVFRDYSYPSGDFICCEVHRDAYLSNPFVENPTTGRLHFFLTVNTLDHDGDNFGFTVTKLNFANFVGARKIKSLEWYPLKYHQNPEAVKKRLTERGERFLAIAISGRDYYYKGSMTERHSGDHMPSYYEGRIMIDAAKHREIHEALHPKFEPRTAVMHTPLDRQNDVPVRAIENGIAAATGRDREARGLVQEKEDVEVSQAMRGFTRKEKIIASPTVFGFALQKNLWCVFFTTCVEDIRWDRGYMDNLILPEDQKNVLSALVGSYLGPGSDSQIEIMRQRSPGLVTMLQGPSGSGKSSTAQAIADLYECPLYVASLDALSAVGKNLKTELHTIRRLARRWDAMVMLNGAGGHIRRSNGGLHSEPSTFLILTEFLQDCSIVVFLATDAVSTFDNALVTFADTDDAC